MEAIDLEMHEACRGLSARLSDGFFVYVVGRDVGYEGERVMLLNVVASPEIVRVLRTRQDPTSR